MSTKTFLLTGGRAPATLDLARLLASAGHRVLLVESFKHAFCRASRAVTQTFLVPSPRFEEEAFLSALQKIVLAENVDVLIPTSEEIFVVARGLNKLAPHTYVWVEPFEILHSLHSKWELFQLAKQYNYLVPKTWKVTSLKEIQEIQKNQIDKTQFILKPVYSRFSAHVHVISNEKNSLPQININPENPWILQEFIEGNQVCTYGLAYRGKLLAHVAYRTTFTAGRGASITFAPYRNDKLIKLVQKWVEMMSFTGQISFDWMETTRNELFLIECNPRLTSGIHLFHQDDGLANLFIDPVSASFILPKSSPKMISLAMLTYGLRSVRSLFDFKQWAKTFLGSQDVIFRWNDPLPYFYQGLSLFSLWRMSRCLGISMIEATTYDMEWNGEGT
ncbi:ATP-grasp domain-containing protein [Thermoflavimicrobium daqui]|jgi:glutathione synthase/RimK-type ligase-like ATP-grasp enzyme|uniref:Carbamoylphosphate synthase large subunit n=1 Tax=Thermoflavimicrobium daqui TaxID=2137476 RepID=A0A364K574_9BACL|nr:ATP-grasp domain-containing protein [Thermoflavimicrobium daqui]RAL24487.1 carbamoylphosphate synthase large subunit [Thermoflavimicrobium daqui]